MTLQELPLLSPPYLSMEKKFVKKRLKPAALMDGGGA